MRLLEAVKNWWHENWPILALIVLVLTMGCVIGLLFFE